LAQDVHSWRPPPSPHRMWAPWDLRRLAFCVVVVRLGCSTSLSRDYVPGTWSASFYRPREVQIEAVGIVNENLAYFQTRWGVSALHDGLLTPVIEVDKDSADITAFHVCHHRGSIFYEVLSRDGGAMTIFEFSLGTRQKEKVREFQDVAAATSLACVDQLLLRASRSNLLAVHLRPSAVSVLRTYGAEEHSSVITSLAVGYAADVVSRAQVFAAVPENRTLLRLHITNEGGLLVARSEPLLLGGDGSDGPLDAATAHDPQHVLWSRGKVLFVDGCALREVDGGSVRTLLGAPESCIPPANETVEPVPWASRLSRPAALAGSADATAVGAVLLLTGAEVVQVVQRANDCVEHLTDADCVEQHGCGWAESSTSEQHACFDCNSLEEWANRQRPAVQACSLEGAPRAGTRYSLTGCGCVAPSPAPPPAPPAPADSGGAANTVQAVLAVILIIAAAIAGILLYRAFRRAAVMRELYGVDTAEFHTFTDDECPH